MTTKDQYFKVQTESNGDTATIFLYDYIGAEYWWEEDDTKDLTDIAFVQKMRELEASHSRINIRISSPGGSVKHGLAMMTAIGNSSVEVHTYADGVVASMAADIFLAAPNRHMAKNALLMIHGALGSCWGNAETMRREADTLDKMNEAASVSLVEATSMSQEEVNERFYDGNDHWLTYSEANELGIVNGDADYDAEGAGEAESMKRATYDFFKSQKEKFQAHFKTLTKVQAPEKEDLEIVEPSKEFEMTNISEIVQATKDGKIDKAALMQALTAQKTVSEQIADLTTVVGDLTEQVKALGSENGQLHEENAALKAQMEEAPAAPATTVPTDGDAKEPVQLDKFQKQLEEENRRLRGK